MYIYMPIDIKTATSRRRSTQSDACATHERNESEMIFQLGTPSAFPSQVLLLDM